jgi:hypothetical protein
MNFLDSSRIRSNMCLATTCLLSRMPSDRSLHTDFVRALNVAQTTTIRTHDQGPFIEFDNPELVAYLTKKEVFTENEIKDKRHLLADRERELAQQHIEAALCLIESASPELYRTICDLIGSIAVYNIPDRDGGTVSCCIGLIWLSPTEDWTVEYYAEMIVHEFVHNSVFLDDMVNGIMPNPELVTLPEAHAISVLRKTRRPYDKAFHSACVAVGIMYLYHRLGNTEKMGSYIDDVRRTAAELRAVESQCRSAGISLLNQNGRDIVDSLISFANQQDFNRIHTLLAA